MGLGQGRKIGAVVEVDGRGAVDDERGHGLDAGALGLGQAIDLVAEVDDLDIDELAVEEVDELPFGIEADGVEEGRFHKKVGKVMKSDVEGKYSTFS